MEVGIIRTLHHTLANLLQQKNSWSNVMSDPRNDPDFDYRYKRMTEVQSEPYDPEEDEEDEADWPSRDDLPHEDDEDSVLIDETGGLTAEGYEILAQLDAAGYFV
jgi:hypothetical protein|tara:strand:- start:251 stop:565 length:315 start_codon:yes stop_codon:yes gene_type:complete